MNPIAQELNAKIQAANPAALESLSQVGKELYFPSKGILAQSAEAKEKAKKFNATIGIATAGDAPLVLPSIAKYFTGITPGEAFNYAPSFGIPPLRTAWKDRMVQVNPSLAGKAYSQPVVTCGITHGLSLVGDLLVDAGDLVLMADQHWEYRLIFETRRRAQVDTFPFLDGNGMNVAALKARLVAEARTRKKIILLLNFPNNPTGYSPTKIEADAIVAAVGEAAGMGCRVVVVLDDAYTGLFYEENVYPESLFGRMADLHEKVLAVKLDGATKEYFVWGFRVGFLTWAGKGLDGASLAALEQKTGGAVRGTISNDNAAAQAILAKALRDPATPIEYKANFEILKKRALAVKAVLADGKFRKSFTPYPFNSGYFMLLRIHGVDSEKLRVHLLDRHGVGAIATAPTDLRIAFSCVNESAIPELFQLIHQAVGELAGG